METAEQSGSVPVFIVEFSGIHSTFPRMEQTPPSQLAQYIPVLFLLAAAIGFAGGTLILSALLGKYARTSKAKDTAYECGKEPIGERLDAVFGEILPRRHAVHPVRYRSRVHVSVGGRLSATCWPNTPRAT
jgi:hypothetical protein